MGKPVSQNGVTFDQIRTLLEAAGKFDQPSSGGLVSLGSMAVSVASAVTVSANSSAGASISDEADDNSNNSLMPKVKRRRQDVDTIAAVMSSAVPKSITTSATPVGC